MQAPPRKYSPAGIMEKNANNTNPIQKGYANTLKSVLPSDHLFSRSSGF